MYEMENQQPVLINRSMTQTAIDTHMGLSENSVPLNPMVNDHYPHQMAISLGIYPTFSDKPT